MSGAFSHPVTTTTFSPEQDKVWEDAQWETSTSYEDMTITDRFIRGSNIRGCKLVNVSLMECNILESTMESCMAVQCRFGRFLVIIDQHPEFETIQNELSAWTCGFKDCSIGNMTLYNSKILFGLLINCLVNTSGIEQTAVRRKLDFRNCSVKGLYSGTDPAFLDSHECKVDEESKRLISNGIITKSPLAFNKFAPEIRYQIFSYCLEWPNTKARTPNLIIALRGDSKLYHEALDLFYKANTFNISYENKLGRELMNANAFVGIRKLALHDHFFSTRKVPEKMLGATMVQQLAIVLYCPARYVILNEFIDLSQIWVTQFNLIKKLSLVIKVSTHKMRPWVACFFSRFRGDLNEVAAKVDASLGTVGLRNPIGWKDGQDGDLTIIWEAVKEEVLFWQESRSRLEDGDTISSVTTTA